MGQPHAKEHPEPPEVGGQKGSSPWRRQTGRRFAYLDLRLPVARIGKEDISVVPSQPTGGVCCSGHRQVASWLGRGEGAGGEAGH